MAEEILRNNLVDPDQISKAKLRIAKNLGLSRIPSNLEILSSLSSQERERLSAALRRKKVRSLSGVTIVTVATPPHSCPHGRCSYCPGGVGEGTPQSYTILSPATRLGLEVNYDPYLQVERRLKHLEALGHKVDKVELILVGGTFNAVPEQYQKWFLKRCLDSLNGVEAQFLEDALKHAESATRRVSGITFETKPDWAKLEHASKLLEMGVTRVEIGVQALDDEILAISHRGHTVEDVVEATRSLKDLAFKVTYHLMPNLPGSDVEMDIRMFRTIFEDSKFRPDMLKIYPTLVLAKTPLYHWWKRGDYSSYSREEMVGLLEEWFRLTPRYVRIQRMQREIPSILIKSGVDLGNVREIVEQSLRSQGHGCVCIRCREVGRRQITEGVMLSPEDVKISTLTYEASAGVEHFISAEDHERDVLVGFARLRIPSCVARKELVNASLLRELHVYGTMVPVQNNPIHGSWQHMNYGSKLLLEAERISREDHGRKKIVVISGVGVRRYYYSRGYAPDGPYVSKKFS